MKLDKKELLALLNKQDLWLSRTNIQGNRLKRICRGGF